jgi:hypothetical protein
MPKLNFFTPVAYAAPSKSIGSSLLEKVDSYFYLGGKKAHVIQGRTKNGQEKVILSESRSSLLARVGKVVSYFTIVIPILMLIAKAVLRSTHSFKLIDPKQKLEKGMDISEQTAAKIQGLMPKILRGQKDDKLEWLSTRNNLVFKLAQHPQFLFKIPEPNCSRGKDKLPTGGNDKTDSRFENMVKAKEVCVANELDLLIIPHAKKFTVNVDGNDYAFIVEESLDFDPNESAHEELYHKSSTKLNETAHQLATFVAKTGFNDATWRNVSILKEAQEFQGPRRIALIDLEHMKSTVNGFIGDSSSCGLIRCVSEAQIDIVIAEARKQIDPKQKLEKGMDISEQTAAKIQGLMPKILGEQKDDELEWLSMGNNLVFKLAQHPQFVFKISKPNCYRGEDKLRTGGNNKTDSRFENMVKAKEVCVANKLDLLIIPHAKKFTVNVDGNDYAFIVEESLDCDPNESATEELYHKYSTKLNETARQLAIFVAKTGFNDVAWRNIPILKEAQEFQGPRRIALIDLEHMKSTVNGFIGDSSSCGLIRCVSEAQIDIVIAEARKQGVAITDEQARDAKNRRLQELESDKTLRTFYERNGIITGKEPIQVDLDLLGLDLTEEGQIFVLARDEDGKLIMHGEKRKWEEQTITLRKATEDVITEMNMLIQNSSDQASTKGKRYFVLNTKYDPFKDYDSLGLPADKSFANEEEKKQSWIRRIVAALVDKGHILKLNKVRGCEYFIQA